MLRRVITVLFLFAVLVGCGSSTTTETGDGSEPSGSSTSAAGDDPKDAKSITYDASYADLSIEGEADVTYTNADGEQISEHVTIPWTGPSVAVKEGQSYTIEVTAPPREDANVACHVLTDNGWTLGDTRADGQCTYTFPDDLEDDEP